MIFEFTGRTGSSSAAVGFMEEFFSRHSGQSAFQELDKAS